MGHSSRFGKPVYYLLLAALLLLSGIQAYWLRYTYQQKQRDFDEKVRLSLRVYGNLIQQDSTLVRTMRASWYDSSRLPQTAQVLRYSLDTFFVNSNMPPDYVFGIGRSRSPASWVSDAAFRGVVDTTRQKIVGICMDKAGALFVSFAWPGKSKYLFGKLLPLLALSAFSLLLLVFCFIHLARTIRRQRQLAEMKNDFINNMTHELKTPLFTISLASRLVSEQPGTPEKGRAYLQSIRQESSRLQTLLETVLDAAQLEQKKPPGEKTTVDCHSLIGEVAETFRPLECERNGSITLQLSAGAHHIHADPVQMTNVLHNLLDNAFKYTGANPQITLTTTNKDQYLVLSVKDNGIGLDGETKEHVFERFYRAHTGNLHHVKGYGIGLYYVKSVVQAHEGTITVKSVVNKGSEFIIHLPSIQNGKPHPRIIDRR